jgi:hypothetical protein
MVNIRQVPLGKTTTGKLLILSIPKIMQAHLKYSGTAVTNQNFIHEEIKSKLNSGNACCSSVQNLLSSRLRSKNVKIEIYKIMVLPVILYGCKTWSLAFGIEHRLRVYESRVVRRIFGPKRDEIIGGWRKLHNEAHRNFYSSPNIIRLLKFRRVRWAEHVARMGETGNAYGALVGSPEGKRPLRRLRPTILKYILEK